MNEIKISLLHLALEPGALAHNYDVARTSHTHRISIKS
jgi:hypothetical protein